MKITIEIPDNFVPAFGASLIQVFRLKRAVHNYFEKHTKEILSNLLPEVDNDLISLKQAYDTSLQAKRDEILVNKEGK
jgi:hypothetical protein